MVYSCIFVTQITK